MSIVDDLTLARSRLANYLAAEAKILNAQGYSVGERSTQRTQLINVQTEIRKLKIEISRLEAGGRGPVQKRVMPRDM
jgi:hypothetical protein